METITNAKLAKANHIIEDIVEEHIREGDDIPAIMWTGNTRRGHNTNIWYELKVVTRGGYTRGWTDGKTSQGMINFREA